MARPVLLVAAVALVSACGTRDAVTMAVALLPAELPAYRAVLADFEAATGTRVVVVPQQYADIRRALAAEAAGGRGTLDLVELDVYSLAPAAREVARLEPDDLGEVFPALAPAAVRAGTIDGLRFVPHRLTWQALVYDHDVLPRPPATWEELLAVARAHPGKIGLKGALYEGLTCDVLPFVWAAGGKGDVLDDDGAIAAFRLFAELAPYLHPGSATFKEPTIADAMARGELVLHLNWPFTLSLFASQGLAPNPIRSAPLPRGPAGRATVLGGGYLALPRNAPHRAAALALVRHLLGRDVQARLARELGWFSARRDVAVGGDGLFAGFAAMGHHARPRPERADYGAISRAWQQAFRTVVFEHADAATTLHAAAARAAEQP
ncbi:MAG TPA: extracellular solute-binding protein [Candidatus Binatia bacterium]|nr:extracellular solute-binding protein [Candidatus Binatia bacterium]